MTAGRLSIAAFALAAACLAILRALARIPDTTVGATQ